MSNSTATKYCDLPGAENHIYELAVPGVVMLTGCSRSKARPVQAHLIDGGWIAGGGLADGIHRSRAGKGAVTPPVAPTVISSGLVDW